jgi:hypothetical protein
MSQCSTVAPLVYLDCMRLLISGLLICLSFPYRGKSGSALLLATGQPGVQKRSPAANDLGIGKIAYKRSHKIFRKPAIDRNSS